MLAVVFWATLGTLIAVFLKIALRSDAGFGAVGRGRLGRRELRRGAGVPPVAIPPRHIYR